MEQSNKNLKYTHEKPDPFRWIFTFILLIGSLLACLYFAIEPILHLAVARFAEVPPRQWLLLPAGLTGAVLLIRTLRAMIWNARYNPRYELRDSELIVETVAWKGRREKISRTITLEDVEEAILTYRPNESRLLYSDHEKGARIIPPFLHIIYRESGDRNVESIPLDDELIDSWLRTLRIYSIPLCFSNSIVKTDYDEEARDFLLNTENLIKFSPSRSWVSISYGLKESWEAKFEPDTLQESDVERKLDGDYLEGFERIVALDRKIEANIRAYLASLLMLGITLAAACYLVKTGSISEDNTGFPLISLLLIAFVHFYLLREHLTWKQLATFSIVNFVIIFIVNLFFPEDGGTSKMMTSFSIIAFLYFSLSAIPFAIVKKAVENSRV